MGIAFVRNNMNLYVAATRKIMATPAKRAVWASMISHKADALNNTIKNKSV